MVAVVEDPRPLEFVHVAQVNGKELKFWRLPMLPDVPHVDVHDIVDMAGVTDEDLAEEMVSGLLEVPAYAVYALTGTGTEHVQDVRAIASFCGALVLIDRLRCAGYCSPVLQDQFLFAMIDACKASIIEGDPPSDVAALDAQVVNSLTKEVSEMTSLFERWRKKWGLPDA